MSTRAPDTLRPADDWRRRAACLGLDTDGFFEDRSGHFAGRVCSPCPVREACLADAMWWEGLRGNSRFGVYGGLTSVQRQALADRTSRDRAAERDAAGSGS